MNNSLRSVIKRTPHFKKIASFNVSKHFENKISSIIPRSFSTHVTPVCYNYDNVVDMQLKACEQFAESPVFGTRVGDKFEWMKYKDFGKQVQLFRNVLVHHKIGKNDKVAIISNNRIEWAVANYATVSLGAQLVPMYEAQLEKDWKFIIEDSGAKLVIAATEKIRSKISGYIGTHANVESVLCLDSEDTHLYSYKRWMKIVENEPPVEPIHPSLSDIAVIIYTSGTTGNPKGVELSHGNIAGNLNSLQELWGTELHSHTSLAYLPWAHVFGQTAELHSLIATGSAMGIVPERERILESFQLIKPSILLSVPVLFNRVYDQAWKKIRASPPVKQWIVQKAFKIARKRNLKFYSGESIDPLLQFQHSLADKIVFSKIREVFGGKLRFMPSGGAAVSQPVLEFFEDIGIPICEGYGLTETSPVITSSGLHPSTRLLGSVGPPVSGTTVLILDPDTLEEVAPGQDGEVCVSGPQVMVGYRNNPEANAEVFFVKDGKRFFKTGDLGRMIDGKFLKITGRIKEQFKLENGKYVVPAPLEDDLCRSAYILQAYVYGNNHPFNVALIVPDFAELRNWVVSQKISIAPEADNASLLQLEPVQKLLGDEVAAASGVMKNFEKPQRWFPLTDTFNADNQMLTPKMSLRRKNIHAAYSSLIDEMYEGKRGYAIGKVHFPDPRP